MAGHATGRLRLDEGSLHLAPGSHSSPRDGVCAVELASLLAGEKFSDRPRCVCRVVAASLRSFNDRASHADRQRLIPYARRAVGTRGDRELTRARRELCLVWAGAHPDAGPLRSLWDRIWMRGRIWVAVGFREALRLNDGAGEYAARAVFARYGTEAAFSLLDRLLEIGEEPQAAAKLEPAPLADPVQGAAQARVASAIRELAGDAQRANGENGGQGGHDNGNGAHLAGRDPGQADEEDVEDYRPHDRDPEREPESAEHPHDLARVP